MFARHPRLRGVVVILEAATCIGFNLGMMAAWDHYLSELFPFAFAMLPIGIALPLFGWHAGTPVRRDVAFVMLALTAAGVLAGVLVNRSLSH